MSTMTHTKFASDTQLVDRCLGGDRDAFGRIVERYQGLVCAVAYSACGDVARSEDLAQETFLAAWHSLKNLKDTGRLKQWLCGIARHLIQESYRRAARDPIAAPASFEEATTVAETIAPVSEQAISKEEQDILWRVLEGLPPTYREPLVLFYRQEQSVAEVAEALELSEDTVKQRLSRGRTMLGERMEKFIETTLHASGPTKAFSLGVLAALPAMTTATKAAAVGATATKGGAAVKSAGLAGLVKVVFGAIAAFFSLYFWYLLDRDNARPQRREFVIQAWRIIVATMAVFALAALSLMMGGRPLIQHYPSVFAGLIIALFTAYGLFIIALNIWMARRRTFRQQETDKGRDLPAFEPLFEYRSRLLLLGWPVVHIRIRGGLERGPVKAWIAVGDSAIGLIFALGALAVAPFSLGGIAVVLLTFGGLALGLVSLGALSFGSWACGGLAVGWYALGACAVSWTAAQGSVAVSHDFAVGAVALARHANDAAAVAFMGDSTFFRTAVAASRHVQWLSMLCLLPPALWLWWRHKDKRRPSRPNV
jgi:RNA polymerase sigma factor (sigma-70 family)